MIPMQQLEYGGSLLTGLEKVLVTIKSSWWIQRNYHQSRLFDEKYLWAEVPGFFMDVQSGGCILRQLILDIYILIPEAQALSKL